MFCWSIVKLLCVVENNKKEVFYTSSCVWRENNFCSWISYTMLNITAVVVFLILLAVVAVFLNILCIYIIRTSKNLRDKPSSLLVLNLLVVHLAQGLFVFPFYAGKKLKVASLFWGRVFANGFRFSYMLTFYGTCLGVLFISVDRFLAAFWFNKYKPRVTKRRVKLVLVLLWIYIISLCLIPFIPQEKTEISSKAGNVTKINSTLSINSTLLMNSSLQSNSTKKNRPQFYFYVQQKEWVVFMLCVNTALPYLLIILSYVHIIHKLKIIENVRTGERGRSHSAITLIDRSGKEIELRKKDIRKYKEVTLLTFILAITYAVFWTPSTIYYPILDMCKNCFPEDYDDSPLEQHIGFIVKYLAFLDAVAAPLIYCFHHGQFRKSLLRMRSKLLREYAMESHGNDSTELM